MKVILVNPGWDYKPIKKGPVYNRKFPPTELVNIAGLLLQNNIDATIFDANIYNLSPEQVSKKVHNYDKVIISSTSIDKWICPDIDNDLLIKTVSAISSINKETYVLGAYPTIYPEKLLRLTGARASIIGEPELAALDLVLKNKLSECKGIGYIDDSGVFHMTGSQLPLDLNAMPVPAFHLFRKDSYYYEILGDNMMLFEGSRGCSFPCIFCFKTMYGDSVRKKDPQKLIQEVDYAIKTIGIKSAYFIDLEFTVFKENVMELCELLIKKGTPIKWCCQTRADLVDIELLEKMKKAGCTLIHYGVESGSERILKIINKKITKEKIIEGINLTKKTGIDIACFFMFGFPGETVNEMKETIKFACQLDPTYASFHIAIPYQTTEFYKKLTNPPIDQFPLYYNEEFSYKKLSKIARKAFLSFYLRPSYIIGKLKKLNLKNFWKQLKIFLWYIR